MKIVKIRIAKLKKLRLKLEVSQSRLEKICCFYRSYICKIENGKASPIPFSLDLIEKTLNKIEATNKKSKTKRK